MPELSERAGVRRLLDRFGFGARPGELGARFAATAQRLLGSTDGAGAAGSPPPDLGAEPATGSKDPAVKKAAEATLGDQNARVTLWWLDRMVASDPSSVEKTTWFWHGHFATGASMVRSARLMLAQNGTLRRLGAGGFAALAAAMVVDPAMLVWLNGNENRVGSPNENLARELMELFTLGVGRYSEADVREAARALTGWTVDKPAIRATLDPRRHDTGAKTVLGTAVPDAPALVDMLVHRPESARFIASRVWFRFVSPDPPPPPVLDRLVAAYGTRLDVWALLRAVVAEPAFRDSGSVLVKQPVEWVVGLMRAAGVRPSALPAKDATGLRNGLKTLGQVPFEPPSVGGWPAGRAWLTTGAALGRLSLAQLVARNASLAALTDAAPAARVEAVRALLGVESWSARTADALTGVGGDPRALLAVAACAPEYVVSG